MTDKPEAHPRRPTVYLDQNMLDVLATNRASAFFESLRDEYQVIYSPENLAEIRRAGTGSGTFLEVLKNLNAHFMKLSDNNDSGSVATHSSQNVFHVFESYCVNDDEYNEVQDSLKRLAFKAHGGLPDTSLRQIIESIRNETSNLLDVALSELPSAIGDQPELERLVNRQLESLKAECRDGWAQVEHDFCENIPNDASYSAMSALRAQTGLGPRELNNIKSPDVLRKIWMKHGKGFSYNEKKLSIEAFYCINQNFQRPGEPLKMHEKIISIYGMLNMLGYWPDDKIDQERSFTSASSDQLHASFAWVADFLLSADKRFTKKAEAIYEFLGVRTRIF